MFQKIISTFMLMALIVVPVMAASSSFLLAGTAGSISLQQCSSQINADKGIMKFGSNNSTQYTEDNSQASILTNGRTYVQRETKIDQSSGNFYASETKLATDYMGIAEDTAGMMNILPNEPENMCDSQGLLSDGTSGSSGQYPVSESYEGRTGAIFHDGGTYSSEVGLLDGDVHLKSEVYSENKAIQYMNVHTNSKKGFNRSNDELNLATYEDINYVGTTVNQKTREDETLDQVAEHNYGSYVDAFAEILAEKEYEATKVVSSISADRVNETVNETVNITPQD
ncbi:MAG: hypothetical protein BWY45_02729 [Euryarchaeota archaeon ADurb.Bin294]|nr:MAG: hypothetical protein BWY45_02729 [Euryarchaeota archaeon ADurb.Bin294]